MADGAEGGVIIIHTYDFLALHEGGEGDHPTEESLRVACDVDNHEQLDAGALGAVRQAILVRFGDLDGRWILQGWEQAVAELLQGMRARVNDQYFLVRGRDFSLRGL